MIDKVSLKTESESVVGLDPDQDHATTAQQKRERVKLQSRDIDMMNLIIIKYLIFIGLFLLVSCKNELVIKDNNKKEVKKATHVMLDIDLDNIIDINNKQSNNQQLYIKVLNSYNILICENKINLKYKKLQCNIPSQYINEGNNILYITIYNPNTMEILGSLDASFIVEYDITNDNNIIPKEFSVYKTSNNNHNHMNLLTSQYYNTFINQDNIKKYVIGFIIFSGFILVYFLLPNSDLNAVPIIDSAPAPNPFDYPSNDSGTNSDGSYPYTPPIPSLPVYTNPTTTPGTGMMWGGPNPNKITNYGIGVLAAGTGIFLLGQTIGGGNRQSDAYIGRNRRRGGGLYDRYNYINTLPSPTLIVTTTKTGTLPSTYDVPYTLPTPQVTHISNGNTSILRTITNIIWVTIYKTFQDRPF